jgi:hypothetical protein
MSIPAIRPMATMRHHRNGLFFLACLRKEVRVIKCVTEESHARFTTLCQWYDEIPDLNWLNPLMRMDIPATTC